MIKPSVIVFGVGHSNTSITVRQVEALGWCAWKAEGSFHEHPGFVEQSRRIQQGKSYDLTAMQRCVTDLEQHAPWTVKDPFLIWSLDKWAPLFASNPVLLWITKNPESVLKSHLRRRETVDAEGVAYRHCLAQDQFDRWPGGKLRLAAEAIASAIALWEPR